MADTTNQSGSGWGLSLFKSSSDAYKQDVVPRATGAYGLSDDVFGGPLGSPTQQGGSGFGAYGLSDSAFGGMPDEEPVKKVEDQSNFGRGWDVSGKQLKQTAYGTAALIGDTIGASGVREWGLKGFKDAEKEVQAISKDSDSFTNAMQSGELGKWFTYSSGYLLGQVAELGAASLAGAAIGSAAAPGAGTAAGAITGAIEKGAVEAGIKGMVAKMIDKEATRLAAEGMAKEVAAETAMKSVYRTIGATTANTFLNATQELGSIYGDAVEQAAQSGQEYSLGKVWLSGIMATAVDSWADSKAVGNLMDAFKGGKGLGGVAVEAFKGGFREGMTEGVQTAIERWGADKDLASQEAYKEYIDSAAVGVLGGSISGGSAAGVKRMLEPSENGNPPPAGTDETKTGFQETGTTDLPAGNSGRNAVQADEFTMPQGQFMATLGNVGFVASIYQDAVFSEKQRIDMAIDRAGLRREFDAAFKDGELMAQGQALLTSNPEERDLFMSALDKYATTMPRQGRYKTAPVKPMTEEQRLAQIDQANEAEFGPVVTNNAAAPAEPEILTPRQEVEAMSVELPSHYEKGVAGDYGITSYSEPYSQSAEIHRRVYSHAALPGMYFNSQKDVFEALKIRKQAKTDGTWDIEPTAAPVADTTQAQDVSQTEVAPAQDEQHKVIVEHLSKRSEARGNGAILPEDVEMSTLPDAIGKLAKAFGVEVVGFKSEKSTIRGFAGDGKVFINTAYSGEKDVRFVLGHEVWHHLEKRDPKLAAELAQEIVKYIKGDVYEKYASEIERIGYSKEKLNSEAAGDLMGIMFTDREFWEKLGEKNPSMVQRVLDLINQLIETIQSKAKAERFGLNKDAITDLNQVRDMLTDIAAKLGEQQQAVDTDIDLMDEGDAVSKVKSLLQAGDKAGAAKLFSKENIYSKSGKKVSFTALEKEHYKEPGKKAEAQDTIDEVQGVDYGTYKEAPKKSATKKAVKPAEKSVGQMRLGLQHSPAHNEFKKEVDSILNMTANSSDYRKTLAKMYEAVAKIDEQLRQGRTIEDGGKKFEAVDESDENAYIWEAFGTAKSLPQDQLLAMRRSLLEDISNISKESQAGLARLFKNNLKRISYELSVARAQAIKRGLPRDVVDPIWQEANNAIIDYNQTLKSERKNKSSSVINEEAADNAMAEAFQTDMFEGQKVAMGLIADFRTNRITSAQLVNLERQGLRDGDFNHVELIAAYRAFGLDPSHDVLNTNSQLSVRSSMLDHLRQNDYSTAARNEWLTSMHKVVTRYPGMLNDYFTEGERRLYAEWVQPRKALEKRLKVTETMQTAQDPRDAFSNLLFVKYGLEQMRNPDSIKDEVTRNALKSTIPDLEQAWLQDLAYALRRRPSLANQIFDAEDGLVIAADKATFDNWIDRQKKARDKDVELMIKAPYFMELRNIDGFAERVPGRSESEQPGPISDSVPGNIPELRKAPSEWEQLYTKIANADIESLDRIRDMMSRLSALRNGNIDPETGELLSDEMADELAAEAIDSVIMNSMMTTARDQYGNEMGQYGATYTPDIGFGMTVEKAGERDLGVPTDADINLENSAENEAGIYEVTEDNEITDEQDQLEQAADTSDVGEVLDEARKNKFKPRGIPKSLEGGDEYEFMDDEYDIVQGPWRGAPAMASLADQISKLDSPVPVTLLEHAGQLPEPLRSKVMERLGKNLGAKGLYHDGQVYVFGSQILGPTDLKFTVFHEVYGHLGLRAFLGAKFDTFLETAYRTSNEVKTLADLIMQEKGVGKLEAVDEVLAGMAATDYKATPVQQWIAKVVEGLRSVGFDSVADWLAQSSGAEIAFTLQRAKEAVRSGEIVLSGSPEEFRLAEQTLPYEMFAKSGDRTRAYVRYNPVTDTWAAFIANGNDLRDGSGYTSLVFDTYQEAYDAIKVKGKVERRTRSGMYIDDKIPPDLVKMPDFKNVGAWESFKRNFITRVQNEYHPIFQVVDHLRKMGRINEQIDVKEALMLYERRTGAAVEYFRQHHVEPILKMVEAAGKLGADLNVINRYITARHAAERNKVVSKVNPEMQDGGSGMSYADADEILNEVSTQPYAKVLEDIGARLDRISREKLEYMLAHGMITKKAFEKMSQYEHYVNLSGVVGVDEEYDDPGMLAGGNKFNAQKGAEKRAFGRGLNNEAPDVLARTILSAEAQIIRANKNMVAQRLLSMLEVNYDPNFATVNKQAFKRQVSPVTGEVEFVPDSNYMAQKNVMVAKVRGIPVTIEFNDNTAGSFADAIHGMVMPPQATPIMAKLGEVNQFMGQMLTTWNPAWIAVNFARDVQTMYFNAATDGRITKAQARQMLKVLPKAIATSVYYSNPEFVSKYLPFIKPDREMLQTLNEMKVEGGLTSFVNRHGLEDQVDQINAALYGKTRMQKLQGFFGFMEMMTIPMEVAPRLAAYKVVRDGGFKAAQAATFSGEITINFNMRGSMKELRQLYLFFNPAVQGTAKMFDLAKKNPGKMAKYAALFAGVGALANLFARAASGDDDDEINRLDKIPVYKRATSIVLWANGPAIPIPYGWNAFYAAGHFAMDTLIGAQPASVSAKRIAVSTFEAFSPLGTAGLDSKDAVTAVAKGIAPTAALPLVEYMANENRYGAPIRQEQSAFDMAEKPDAQSYFRSVSPISKAVTDTLSEMTGGNKFHKGAIDVNPSVVDFMISSYLPGFANEAYKGASLAVRAAKGEELKDAPLPLLGRFEARVPEGYDAGAFRRASTLVETTYKEYKMVPERRDAINEEFPSIGAAHAVISSTTQQIREIHKAMDNTDRNLGMTDSEKVERQNQLRQREKETYQRAVKRLSSLGGQYKQALIEAQ